MKAALALALLLAACGGHIDSGIPESDGNSAESDGTEEPATEPEPGNQEEPAETPDPDLEVPQVTPTPVDEPEPEPVEEPEPECIAETPEPLPGSGGRAKACGRGRDSCGEPQDFGECFGEDLCGGDGTPNVCGLCRQIEGDSLIAASCQTAFTGCDPRRYAQFGCNPITLSGDDGVFRLYLCCN